MGPRQENRLAEAGVRSFLISAVLAIFRNTSIGIEAVDSDGNIIQINTALSKMLGYSEEELRDVNVLAFTHPDDVPASADHLAQLAAAECNSYHLEKRYIRKDGRSFWADVSVSAVRNRKGEYEGAVGVITDITDRKNAEAKLHQLEERCRSVVENSGEPSSSCRMTPSGTLLKERDGNVIGAVESRVDMTQLQGPSLATEKASRSEGEFPPT